MQRLTHRDMETLADFLTDHKQGFASISDLAEIVEQIVSMNAGGTA